jgi:hypothetical protein
MEQVGNEAVLIDDDQSDTVLLSHPMRQLITQSGRCGVPLVGRL